MATTLDAPVAPQNGTPAHAPDDREDLAARLVRAAANKSYNPDTDIAWPDSIANDRFFLPEHRVSLYGTRLWARMSQEQRILLSRHEVGSMAQAGVWFELILSQLLIRFIYDEDYISHHTRWALTEIADECRHSMMFGEYIRRAGTPTYAPAASLGDAFGPADSLPGGRA
ncbi:MAG: diiron oxygenase, partial [Candidatus Dormibacteraeota bacterium]|nr:diiron oxygenase [Candidatus Dormibacteraeota bacterium]